MDNQDQDSQSSQVGGGGDLAKGVRKVAVWLARMVSHSTGAVTPDPGQGATFAKSFVPCYTKFPAHLCQAR